jgi:hypothetical protein
MIAMLLACAAWLLSTAAHAENGENFAMQGVGTATCTQFANHYKSEPQFWEDRYFTWAQGFMSGHNFATMGDKPPYSIINLALLDTEAQRTSIRRYCDQHPLGSYLDAVTNLMLEIQATELQMKSQPK